MARKVAKLLAGPLIHTGFLLKIILDIETNGLHSPTQVWVVVCKSLMTGELTVFRRLTEDQHEAKRFRDFMSGITLVVGHNLIDFDLPVLYKLVNLDVILPSNIIDTFIVSKLIDYPRETKHSLESYGLEFGMLKGFQIEDGSIKESKSFTQDFFNQYSKELEDYCIRDVHINHKVYLKYKKYLDNPKHYDSILREHKTQVLLERMSNRGFKLDTVLTSNLLDTVCNTLEETDHAIQSAFPPRLRLIRECCPRATKFGTISLTSIPKALRADIHEFSVDAPFSYCEWVDFNPGSPKQVVELLNKAGWEPFVKTKSHLEAEREVSRLERSRNRPSTVALTLSDAKLRLEGLRKTGWKITEENLATLPDTAPAPARLMAKRIMYESRRKTLTEWLHLVQPDGRVHGEFHGIGAWTHRMAHRKPNLANVANEFYSDGPNAGEIKLLGKELRQCWTVPPGRRLVGVDAESIQLRIFAHYVNDPVLINAIVRGKKSDKTDPHNFNKSVLGDACPSRQAAKRYLYALFLGGGKERLRQILGCDAQAAEEAQERLLAQYPGFRQLREEVIPADAKRGWFYGLDGRRVRIEGDTESERRHKAMSGYLQNGEAVVIKEAFIQAWDLIETLGCFFVDVVHDEYQIECPDDDEVCLEAARIVDDAIRQTTSTFRLNCPMAGSYWNDDHNRYSFGKTWYETH